MPERGVIASYDQLPVGRLLNELARSEAAWSRFRAGPEAVLEEFGLGVPGGSGPDRPFCPRRRPETQFLTPLSWESLGSPEEEVSTEEWAPGSQNWVETRLVRNGVKPAARLMIAERALPAILNQLEPLGLCLLIAPYKTTLHSESAKGRCRDQVRRRLPWWYPAPGYFPVYLARGWRQVQLALLWEAVSAAREFGRALGYPPCCVDRFVRLFPRANRTGGDLIPFALRQTSQPPPYPFLINNLTRYFGRRLVSHFPCHYQCPATTHLGQRCLEVVRAESPAVASDLAGALRRPVLHAGPAGIFWMTEYTQESGASVGYNPDRVQATVSEGELYEAVRRSDRLTTSGWPRPRLTLWRGQQEVFRIPVPAWCVTFSGTQSENDSR